MNKEIFVNTARYVEKMYDEYPHPNLFYHTLEHTRKVVEHTEEIAGHYRLEEQDLLVVYVAAWFHDLGHLMTDIANHEEKGVELMRAFMTEQGAEEPLMKSIEDCIWVTRMPHEPKNLLQEIICDADTYHFGTKEFKKTNRQIRKEYRRRNFTAITLGWEKNTLDLLERHQYFTSYCQVLLEEGKQKNIEKARRRYLKTINASKNTELEEEAKNPQLVKNRMTLVARGVQTMLRLTSQNHLRLSDMADGKANILISVNAIIISVVLSLLVRRLETDTYLTIPTILFLLFSVVTIILAIMATRPKISEGRFTKDDIINKRTNLLFFGNFYKSSIDDYEWAMDIMMNDKDYLYTSMVKDIHQLGVVLARKYKLVRLAYTIFMVGIIVCVFAFTLASILKSPAVTTTVTMPAHPPL
jgi:HD superfamily phosphodiesterase